MNKILMNGRGVFGIFREPEARNLLRTEIGSRDVANLVCTLCGPAFARTTGAQVPIDGGNERVI